MDYMINNKEMIEERNKESDKDNLIKRLKEVRAKTGFTQKEFSEYFGMSKRTVEDWERGARKIPDYVLRLIEYKVKTDKIFDNYDDMEKGAE